jgi:putative ABC transport system permease protein
LAVAKLAMHEMLGRAPQNLPLVGSASIDGTTLAVTAIVALMTGIIFGVLPAIQVGKHDLATALRAGARGTRSRPATNRAKQAIVVAEVAVAVTLLTGAGLLLHSFAKLLSVDPGFRTEGVLSMKLLLPQRSYDSTAIRAFIRELEARTRALPGVKSIGMANFIPLDGGSENYVFEIRGRPPVRPSDQPSTEARKVTPDFFATMGMPVIEGRGITSTDQPGAPKVVVVNHAFLQAFFPKEDAIGKTIAIGWGSDSGGDARQIVGVVGDVHSFGLEGAPEPTVYAPIAQRPDQSISIVVRTEGSPATLAAPLRAVVRDLNRELPVYSVQTMEERVTGSVGRQRFYATLIAIFAAVAVVLSAVGLYGVIAYAVSQRTHELGVRVALGATGDRIARMVIGEGLALTAIGIAIGAIASVFAGRLVSSLLFGVSALDPMTIGGVGVVLVSVATLASWLPARRAARVDPLVAMRGD